MTTLSKHLFAALIGTALISSCSRPVAYFQPTTREQFKSVSSETVAVTPVETAQPATVSTPEATPVAASAGQIAQVQQAVGQVEAYVRNDAKLAGSKKLTKRMARLNELLTSANTKAAVTTNATSAKKMNLVERAMLKKMDKKIKNHVAPEKAKAMNSNVRLGLIIGVIGLILLLLGGGTVLGIIGLIGFIVGLVLILIGVINA